MSEHAGIGVEIAGHHQALAQRRSPPDGGCRAAGGRLAPPPASRPWRRCPRTARSPARCAARSRATASAATPSASGWCASRSRSPGRNRCPGSGRSAPGARRPGRTRARPRRRRPQARSLAGRAGRRAGSDGGGQANWSLQSPKPPQTPNLHAGSAFNRSQSAALGKFRHFKSVLGRKDGAGRICDGMPRQIRGRKRTKPPGEEIPGAWSRRKMVGKSRGSFRSEPIEDLVGPEPLEPVQRLVQGRELVGGDAADLLHRAHVLLVETLDDVANLAAACRSDGCAPSGGRPASADDRGSPSRRASSDCRRRWSRGSSRACEARPRSAPCRRCCRAEAPAPN